MTNPDEESARKKYQDALATLRAILTDPRATNQDRLAAASRLRDAGGDAPSSPEVPK